MMRLWKVAILSAVCGASSVWAQTGSRPSLAGDEDLRRVGLRRYWEAHLPLDVGASVKNAFLIDEALYVSTDDGVLFSIESDVGLIRWAERVTEPGYTIYRPAHMLRKDGMGPVVVLTTSGALVLDRYNGGRLMRFEPGFAPGSPPLVVGSRYFAGSRDGRFYALTLSGPGGRPFKLWDVHVGSAITAAPLLYEGDRLIFASQGGGIYSCFASDKTLMWSHRVPGRVLADPVMDESGLYVASLDRSLYKLNLRNGKLMWRVRFNDPLHEAPAAIPHTVYQFTPSRGLVALDADDGAERWVNGEAYRLAAHSRDRDVLYAPDGRLLIVDHESGRSLGAVDVPEAAGVVTNTQSDAVFVFGASGRVLCMRFDDAPYLRLQQVRAAQSTLHQAPSSGSGLLTDFPEPPKIEDRTTANPFQSWREQAPQ